jgi:hypothetical protein
MQEQTSSHLVIIAPESQIEALMAELEGPCTWPLPMNESNAGGLPQSFRAQSAHEKIEIDGRAREHIARFLALPVNADRPEWMPISRMDIEAMLKDPSALDRPAVPFSIPRLAPWADREEFDRYFPGVKDGAFWDIRAQDERHYSVGRLGLLPFSRDRTGCMWPPKDVRLTRQAGHQPGLSSLAIRFRSPFGPTTKLPILLAPVLARHGARAMLLWEDEWVECGYAYADPSRDMFLSVDLGSELASDSGDDEAVGIDKADLCARAIAASGDSDFEALF